MKAALNNLPMRTWLLLMVSVVLAAYPVVRVVLPAVERAVLPELVRSLFGTI